MMVGLDTRTSMTRIDEQLSKSSADANCNGNVESGHDLKDEGKLRLFSAEEVAAHISGEEPWIVVDGEVYNVANFLQNHPGGAAVIVEHLKETDAGQVMRGQSSGSDHAHSDSAFRMLKNFHIGTLEHSSRVNGAGNMSEGMTTNSPKGYTVDLSKPLVFQVGHLGEGYQEWVHQPIVQKESPRFFESNFMESLTKTLWWVIPLVWIPVVCWFQVVALRRGLSVDKLVTTMPLGFFIWSLIEYTMHRFLFHVKTTNYWWNTAHYLLHGCHHKHPMDGYRLVFPPALTAVFCIIFYGLVVALFTKTWAPSVFGGGLSGYIAYDVTHYFIHHGTPFNNITRKLKRYHLNHHFKVQTDGFGITSAFWDWVFGTLPAPLKYDPNLIQ